MDENQHEATGLYVFCLTRPGPVRQLQPAPEGYGPIEQVAVGDVAALFCVVRVEEFQDEGLMGDLRWIAPRARYHDAMVRAVMQDRPVLPVKFGSIFSSRPAIESFLRDRLTMIEEFLGRIAASQEWSVKVYAKPDMTEEPVSTAVEAASPGRNYLQARSQKLSSRQNVYQQMSKGIQEIRQAFGQMGQSRELPQQAKEVSGRAEPMLLNLALLVRQEEVPALEQRAEELSRQYQDQGLHIELSGPWPPYSFCPDMSQEQ